MAEAFSFEFDGKTVNVPKDFHGYYLDFYRNDKFYEDEMLRYIQSLNLKGTYVDVGGGTGNHSLFFAMFCGAKVHTFEPRDVHRTFITSIVNANNMQDRVHLHAMAAGDHHGNMETTFVTGERPVTGTVPCVRLDDAILEDDVKVIKIDVEGAEPAVLRGALGLLKRSKPVLFIEANSDEEKQAIMDVLEPEGFVMTGKVFNHSPTYEIVYDRLIERDRAAEEMISNEWGLDGRRWE